MSLFYPQMQLFHHHYNKKLYQSSAFALFICHIFLLYINYTKKFFYKLIYYKFYYYLEESNLLKTYVNIIAILPQFLNF